MDPKRETRKIDQNTAYLFVGITFLAVGVVSLFTNIGALWISMFVIGIVFISLSFTLKQPAARSADEPTDEPQK